MCDPATVGLIISGVSAGAGVYAATQGGKTPDMPAPTQDAQTPVTSSYRKRNAAAVPGGRTPDTTTLLGSTGNAPSLARSTLLGQ